MVDKIIKTPLGVASDDGLDTYNETKYCINQSQLNKEDEKKKGFLNKLTFRYSLSKITKQKQTVDNIQNDWRYPAIHYSTVPEIMYSPSYVAFENRRYTAHQYSSPRVRRHRETFISYREQQPIPQHKESIKRYTQLLNQKKKNQGGLGSFWMFKKEGKSQHAKVRDNKAATEDKGSAEEQANKVRQAFSRIFVWGKLPVDIETGLVSKNLLKNYLTFIISQNFAQWFINFFQIRSYLNFKEFQKFGEKFMNMSIREAHLVSFMLYDRNGDCFLCPRDVFYIFEKQLDPSIQDDILKIAMFCQQNEGRQEQINEKFKVEHVIIQDDSLNIKDYDVFFKKSDEPFLKATNKKDTGFAKSFAVLDHRQKIRSKRRQLNQKKMMYNQLFQEIAHDNKNTAFVEAEDYRLNYTFLHEVFGGNPTKLFAFFCMRVLGVYYKGPSK